MTGPVGRTGWPVLGVVVAAAALAPLVFTDFFLSVILTKSLWLGVAAASLIFLSAYGGMVSLAQVGIYGVAGMTFANLVAADGGAAAAWSPWLATIAARTGHGSRPVLTRGFTRVSRRGRGGGPRAPRPAART